MLVVQTQNSAVNPRNVEKAIENGGSYEHTVSRLIVNGVDRKIVDCDAVTTIEAYNTAYTRVKEPDGELCTYNTVFVRRMYAVYTSSNYSPNDSGKLVGLCRTEDDAKEELFKQCVAGRFAYITEVWA